MDVDARLDTGMKVKEALARAEHWWDKTGRKEFKRIDNADEIPSGILLGLAWDELNKFEKLRITKVYHHFFVRRPDKLGIAQDARFRLGGEEKIG